MVQNTHGFYLLMLTNVAKLLHIGNTAIHCNHQYMLQDVELELLEDMRDLGVHIDSKLKFHVHTDIVTSKANHTLGLIHKVFECKDSDIIVKLYKSLMRHYLNIIM